MATEHSTPISGLEPSAPHDRSNETLREIINDLLPLFKAANWFLLLALIVVFLFDAYTILSGTIRASERIIDRSVIIAIIAATAAEISVIIIASIKKIK